MADITFFVKESSHLTPNITYPTAAIKKSKQNVEMNVILQHVAYFDGLRMSLYNSGNTGCPPQGAIKIPKLKINSPKDLGHKFISAVLNNDPGDSSDDKPQMMIRTKTPMVEKIPDTLNEEIKLNGIKDIPNVTHIIKALNMPTFTSGKRR